MTTFLPLSNLPSAITYFVNWACNLRCRECWLYGDSAAENAWLEEVKREQASLSTWVQTLDEMAMAGGKPAISIMGGEPLMHPQIIEFVREAKRRLPNCALDMSTNGTLLPRVADRLVRAGIDVVYVSLDGPTPEVNDPIRGPRSYQRAVAGVESLQRARGAGAEPRLALNFTLTGMNYTSLPGMVRLAEQLGVEEVTVDLAMYFTRQEGEETRPSFEAVTGRPFASWRGYCNEHQHAAVDKARLEEALEEAKSLAGPVAVLVAPLRYSSADQSAYFTPAWKHVIREVTCPKLWTQATILPNGDVLSCTPFSDTVMGNLSESSLGEVWRGAAYQRMRKLIGGGLQPICFRCCELSLDIEVDPSVFTLARGGEDTAFLGASGA